MALLPLFFIIKYVLTMDLSSLSLNFFIKEAMPVGETGGGMAHAILGTLFMVSMASFMAIPLMSV